MATAYELRERSRRVSRIAFLPTTLLLIWTIGQTTTFQLFRFLIVGLTGAVIVSGVSREVEEDVLGSILLYTTGLGVSGLGLLSFEIESTGHVVVGLGLLYLTAVYWYARRHYDGDVGMPVGAIFGLAIGYGVLYL